jgi:hypothetical protein
MNNDTAAYVKDVRILFYPSDPPTSINDLLGESIRKNLVEPGGV